MMTCSDARTAEAEPNIRKPLGPKTMNFIVLVVFILGFTMMILPYSALAQSVNVDLGKGVRWAASWEFDFGRSYGAVAAEFEGGR